MLLLWECKQWLMGGWRSCVTTGWLHVKHWQGLKGLGACMRKANGDCPRWEGIRHMLLLQSMLRLPLLCMLWPAWLWQSLGLNLNSVADLLWQEALSMDPEARLLARLLC